MAATLLPNGKQAFTTSAGAPLVGGKVYTYAAGTNNPQATWTDAAQTVPNTNPIILDARGEATVFWFGSYKVVLKDALDNTIWTVDNVQSLNSQLAANTGASMIGTSSGLTVQQALDNKAAIDFSNVSGFIGIVPNFEGSGDTAIEHDQIIFINPSASATDVFQAKFMRRAFYSGGSAGFVNTALTVSSYVNSGAAAFEWNALFLLDNSATAGENVAAYFQGIKRSTGPTWGVTVEAIDATSLANPTTGLVGAEIDIRANGTDNNNNRVGIDVVISRQISGGSPSGAAMFAGWGVRVQSANDGLNSVVKNAFGIAPGVTAINGFTTAGVNITGDAIQLNSGHYISFDENSQHRMRYALTVGIEYAAAGVVQAALRSDGLIYQRPVTFAQLPAAGQYGRQAKITDSNTAVFNAIAAGGGANKVPVFDDGAAWRVG